MFAIIKLGEMMKERIIFHIDCNNAFLSWTAVYMIHNGSKIDIRNRYAVIGGKESERKGIVLAKSNLCKKCGVITGETLYAARRKCPYLEVYQPEFKVYKKYSDIMYTYLCGYTLKIERYSIDECFIDFSDKDEIRNDPVKWAYKIKNDIKDNFGFTVNVGIGNNKLLSKMASDFSKPDKVHTKREYLEKYFKSMGKMMWEYANGIDNSVVESDYGNPKSISNSCVLPYNYSNIEDIYREIRKLAMTTGKKLREKKMYTSNVMIWVKFDDFSKISKQITLDNLIQDDEKIYEYAVKLFNMIWNKDSDKLVRALCVGVNNLTDKYVVQLSMFENVDIKNQEDDKLKKALDNIKEKYGDKSITYADRL